MSEFRIAFRYAKSLLDLAQEQGKLEEVAGDMELFSKVCSESRDLVLMLKNPIVRKDRKRKVLDGVFKGKVSELTLSIFDITVRKGREAFLPVIAKEFRKQYYAVKGIEIAKVITPVPLNATLRKEIEALVKQISTKDHIQMNEVVDESLIGGFILRVEDKQIDDSVKSKLKALKIKLTERSYS